MPSENPFEVSSLYGDNSIPQALYSSPYEFDLDGNRIICGAHLILPSICIYTGATEDLVAQQKQTEFPSMKLVVVQRSCSITMYVANAEKARRTKRSLIWGAVGLFGFATAMAAILVRDPQFAILFPIGIAASCVSLFLLNRWSLPLQLVRYKAPGHYWVKGFPTKFLALLAMDKLSRNGHGSQKQQ